jgi:hypothetical protein
MVLIFFAAWRERLASTPESEREEWRKDEGVFKQRSTGPDKMNELMESSDRCILLKKKEN